jgi:hypothetical protein
MDEAAQEGSGCEDDRPPQKAFPELRLDSLDAPVSKQQPFGATLPQPQAGLSLQGSLHSLPIAGLVGLRPRCPNRRALAGVQPAKLNPRFVDRTSHFATERIDFPYEMTLADPSDRWIARHLPDVVEVQSENQSPPAHPGRSQGRFDAGVTGTHDDDIEELRGPDGMFHVKRSLADSLAVPLITCQCKTR